MDFGKEVWKKSEELLKEYKTLEKAIEEYGFEEEKEELKKAHDLYWGSMKWSDYGRILKDLYASEEIIEGIKKKVKDKIHEP